MRSAVAQFIDRDGPVYAECGGFMYLTEGIADMEGRVWPMAGVFPTIARMRKSLARIGYTEVEISPGETARGHQFRYSQWLATTDSTRQADNLYSVRVRRSGLVSAEGYGIGGVLGSYVHAHWASNPLVAQGLVCACHAFAEGRRCRTSCA